MPQGQKQVMVLNHTVIQEIIPNGIRYGVRSVRGKYKVNCDP